MPEQRVILSTFASLSVNSLEGLELERSRSFALLSMIGDIAGLRMRPFKNLFKRVVRTTVSFYKLNIAYR